MFSVIETDCKTVKGHVAEKILFATNNAVYLLADKLKWYSNHLFWNKFPDKIVCEIFAGLNPFCFCF